MFPPADSFAERKDLPVGLQEQWEKDRFKKERREEVQEGDDCCGETGPSD